MRLTLRGASSAALIVGLFGGTALAQEVTQPPAETVVEAVDTIQAPEPAPAAGGGDRVVITGTLVRGASEDAPLPVQSFSLADLADQGAPTAAEFLRSLSISSEASGEADSQVLGAAAGFANVNLRGLGASRTLVLLNGKRFASTDGGAGADINTLPMMAVGRIDVLKDGASVTYGAGAVGGVVNYITRSGFEGFEINASKKMFEGSGGEDSIDALWGVKGESSDLLVAASYGKRHRLNSTKRSFSTNDYTDSPAIWTTFNSNPSNYYNASNAFGNIRDYTPESCRAIGGEITNVLNPTITGSNALDCAVYLPQYFNLIDEEQYLRGYIEYNSDFSDTQEFHVELHYAKTSNPNIQSGPSLPSGGVRAMDTARTSLIGGFQVPYAQPYYTSAGALAGTVVNPYAAEFYDRAAANGFVTGPRGTLLTSNQWRPQMFGGNPLYPNNHRQESQERERFGAVISTKGDFTDGGTLGLGRFLPENTTYEFSATYSQYTNTAQRPDYIVSRLQNALRGYGGPGCAAIDRVPTSYTSSAAFDASVGIQSDTQPGTNGCEWFNPFASSFATSSVNGAANPAYGGNNFENSVALLDWLTHDRRYETTNNALTIDAIFTGEVPGFELPGGKIGWAAGTQWRQTESRSLPLGEAEEVLIAQSDCPWGNQGLPNTVPGQATCVAQQGPFFSSGLGRQLALKSDRQTISFFGEVQLPVLDNLNFQVALRREDFGDVAGNIWKVAGKYDILPELSLRGSYSTNFQAPDVDIGASGIQTGGVYNGSLFRTIPTQIITLDGITPEDDRAMNLGVIYAPEIFGGQLRASVDFWEIEILGEVANTNTSTVLQNILGSSFNASTLANCSARLINLAEFVTGSCVQGVTTGGALTGITQFTLNTGGFVTNGYDFNIDYTIDVGPGTLIAAASATQVATYKVKGFGIPGYTDATGAPLMYAGDFNGLGYANLGRAGTIMPRWRGNASLTYSMDEHRVNLRANYTSGFWDDSVIDTDPASATYGQYLPNRRTAVGIENGTIIRTDYGYKPNDLVTFDLNYTYTAPFWEDLSFRASILNLTDEDPMPAQNTNAGGLAATRTGYYPGYGDPRGRTFEIGVTKKF